MAYTIEQQFSRDIDWYFLDGNKTPIHVAGGGGQMPVLISENDELNNELHFEVLSLPEEYEVVINPILNQIILFENELARALYIEDFVGMARRYFVSIDKSILGDFENSLYHVVGYPIELVKSDVIIKLTSRFIVSQKVIQFDSTSSFDLLDSF